MYIDHDRATAVFDTLVKALQEKKAPYDGANTPQAIVGERLLKYSDKQRALYWFYLCMYMRGPVKSNYAAAKLFEVFEAQGGGGIFDPECNYSRNRECVDVVMTHHNFTRLLSDVKKFWEYASIRLLDRYDADPRNIYSGVNSFESIEDRMRYSPETGTGFMGFQKKMSSMLTYFLRDQGLISLDNFPPPVDFHLMRVMILTGVLVLEKGDPKKFRYETSSKLGYEAIEGYQYRTGANPIVLGDALWLLSGNLCNISPKNQESLAFGIFCQDTIDKAPPSKRKRFANHPGLFDNEDPKLRVRINPNSQRMLASCGICPARRFCTGGIPAVEYYNYGLLEYRTEVEAA